jgi:hypothetical protein
VNKHPLEEMLNASAWDIMSAIQAGFRAQVDVKGKLAEYYLHQQLVDLRNQGLFQKVEWQDRDGEPDFLVSVADRTLRVECKNIRSNGYRVELQKTRNSRDGAPTRGYRIDEFDVLAVCLFNQTHEWQYLYTATRCLAQRANLPGYLVVMQRVPSEPGDFWRESVREAIEDALNPGTES